MKKSALALLALCSAALVVTGCAGLRDTFYRPVTSTVQVPETVVTNFVTLRTNLVQVPAVVDASGQVLTSAHTIEQVEALAVPVPVITTNPPALVTVTNGWEKRPEVFDSAAIVGSAVPGWGTLAAGLFGAVGTLGAAWLNRKQKGTQAALVGTMQGIEQIRLALQQTPEGRDLDARLVAALQSAQANHNALGIVQQLLEMHTGTTRDQIDLSDIFKPAA